MATPITIKNKPQMACHDKLCPNKKKPNMATVKTPRPLQVAYTIEMGRTFITNVKRKNDPRQQPTIMTVGKIREKFWVTGSRRVPATSRRIAAINKK